MRILLVEDDHHQAKEIRHKLEEHFPGIEIQHIKTESEFRKGFEKLREKPPDFVVMDVMLRWADLAREAIPEPPPEIKLVGFYRAGLRCQQLLADESKTRKVPVILYTLLEADDLERHVEEARRRGERVSYLRKQHDYEQLCVMLALLFSSDEAGCN